MLCNPIVGYYETFKTSLTWRRFPHVEIERIDKVSCLNSEVPNVLRIKFFRYVRPAQNSDQACFWFDTNRSNSQQLIEHCTSRHVTAVPSNEFVKRRASRTVVEFQIKWNAVRPSE